MEQVLKKIYIISYAERYVTNNKIGNNKPKLSLVKEKYFLVDKIFLCFLIHTPRKIFKVDLAFTTEH